MKQNKKDYSESLKIAINEAGNKMRYFLADRFRIISIALAVNGAGLAFLNQHINDDNKFLGILVVVLVIALTFLCLIFDRSSRSYYQKYLDTAREIQKELGVIIYTKDKRRWYKRSTPWLKIFYGTLISAWGFILIYFIYQDKIDIFVKKIFGVHLVPP